MSSLPRGPRRDASCTPYCNSFKLLEKEALAHEALKAQHASCLNEMQVRDVLMCVRAHGGESIYVTFAPAGCSEFSRARSKQG